MFTYGTHRIVTRPIWLVGNLVLLLMLSTAQAQTDPVRSKLFNLDKGVAIQGYDPVVYFVNRKATKGAAQFATTYKGVTYQFASAGNLDLFLKTYWLTNRPMAAECLRHGSHWRVSRNRPGNV